MGLSKGIFKSPFFSSFSMWARFQNEQRFNHSELYKIKIQWKKNEDKLTCWWLFESMCNALCIVCRTRISFQLMKNMRTSLISFRFVFVCISFSVDCIPFSRLVKSTNSMWLMFWMMLCKTPKPSPAKLSQSDYATECRYMFHSIRKSIGANHLITAN